MEDLDELLMSHDELHLICKTLMGLALESGLELDIETRLKEANITPGFAERAQQVEEKYTHRRRLLMATGKLQ